MNDHFRRFNEIIIIIIVIFASPVEHVHGILQKQFPSPRYIFGHSKLPNILVCTPQNYVLFLRTYPIELEQYVKVESSQEDELKRLHNQLETERVLKKEAVNKLTQVMFQRQPQVKGGSGG